MVSPSPDIVLAAVATETPAKTQEPFLERHLQSSDQMSPERLAGRLQRLEEKWTRRHWRPADVTLPLDRDVPAEFFYFSDKEHVFRADADGDTECTSFKDGRIVERLRISPDRRFLACVTWAPAGTTLYVSAQDDKEYGIYRLRMDEFFARD